MNEPDDNPLFDLLVREQDGILGLVAYAFYKRHKREVCMDYHSKLGRGWTDAEHAAFVRSAATGSQLEAYRTAARGVLMRFAKEVVVGARPQIAQDAVADRIEGLAREIAAQGSFAQQIKTGVVSTLITLAVSLVIVLALKLFGIDVIDALRSVGQG